MDAVTRTITITPSAAQRIALLAREDGTQGIMLRLAVSGGGCSGFQYGFSFDDQINDDDRTFEHDGAKIVIDEVSLELLNGAELDYSEDLMAAAFKITNPNAASSCGCGTSFAI